MASTSNTVVRAATASTLKQVLCFAAAYLLAAGLGQWLRIAHDDLPIWWPPSGLFLALLLVHEIRLWTRFAIVTFGAELAINGWLYHVTIPANLAISLAQTLEILICGYLVQRWCGAPFQLRSQRDIVGLTFAALLSPMVGATVGAATIALSGTHVFKGVWPHWWLGDAVGILIVTPMVLALLQGWITWQKLSAAHWVEAAALMLTLVATAQFVFGGHLPLAFLLMPPLLWAGLRFGLPGAVAAATVLSVIAVRHTAGWHGWLASPTIDIETRALLVQSCLGIAGISTVILMALLNQRQAAQQALQQVSQREHASLEARVAERTAALHDTNESLRSLSARQDSLLEAERARLAREIHDELGATITGVTMHVQMALSAGGDTVPVVRERLEEALQLVDAANQSMHRIINDLRPSVLDHLGIWGALEWLANQWQARTGLPCELTLDPALAQHMLEGDRAIALFRIVQESLTNVARHAQATRVDILTQLDGDAVTVTIRDDGKGIDRDGSPRAGSMGLQGMRERARRFGATLELAGERGRGTQVKLRLPLS
jgi:signal transduction histidine kinase